jgi:hypothetical protein
VVAVATGGDVGVAVAGASTFSSESVEVGGATATFGPSSSPPPLVASVTAMVIKKIGMGMAMK